MQTSEVFIGGQWHPPASGETYATINPATEEVSAQVAKGDERDVDLAVQAARRAFDQGPFTGVSNAMSIAREEIFGPVLSVIPFKDADDAVAQGNETFYGLAAAVWTRDVGKALRIARSLRAGTVWVNAYNLYDAALPFGGFKESGFGRELGQAGLDLYTEVKSVWVDLT